jgi:hypothetical protein
VVPAPTFNIVLCKFCDIFSRVIQNL